MPEMHLERQGSGKCKYELSRFISRYVVIVHRLKEIHPRPSGLGYFRYGYEGLDSLVAAVSSHSRLRTGARGGL